MQCYAWCGECPDPQNCLSCNSEFMTNCPKPVVGLALGITFGLIGGILLIAGVTFYLVRLKRRRDAIRE